jgi:ketosteroid isomerase-like protein
MTPEEERNYNVSVLWEQTYNDDVERMCDECYAEDCEVINMATGEVLKGREELRALERAVSRAFPSRRMKVVRRIAAGDTVVVEAAAAGLAEGQAAETSRGGSCVVLTFRDGKIVSDHTYADSSAIAAALGMDPRSFIREMLKRYGQG